MWRDFNFFRLTDRQTDRQTDRRRTDKTDCLTPLRACARGLISVVLRVNFDTIQEIEPKVGGGRYFMRLRYTVKEDVITTVNHRHDPKNEIVTCIH